MIGSVYRVRCDGPGREWLAVSLDHEPGQRVFGKDMVGADSFDRAMLFGDEIDALRGAATAGWQPDRKWEKWLCPACSAAPTA